MCGITGIVYKNTFKNCSDIKRMNDAIAHRGPDGEGFLAINSFEHKDYPLSGKQTPVQLPKIEDFNQKSNAYLAHRRLSIIDLSPAGHQPMANRNQTIWITYNGEIYNYREIKKELVSLGYEFCSNTDTEVLLYAYEQWGKDCLSKLNGMFAFVIYDKRKNIFFGARDRFGVKPFYYIKTDNFFAFNSEIKGLLTLPDVPKTINNDVALTYLTFNQQCFGEQTFFKDILELLPAHYFTFDLNTSNFEIKTYYNLEYNPEWEKFNQAKADEYITNIKQLILDSVDSHLNADVPAGSCLSGGLDSSSIVSAIRFLKGPEQACVTACYKNSKIDESSWAKLVADSVDARWIKTFPSGNELFDDIEDLVYSQDIPFGSTSIYAQYRVMKAAKENGITVMLDGQGGDELFCGYPDYYYVYYDSVLKNSIKELIQESRYIDNSPLNEELLLKRIIKAEVFTNARNYPKFIYNYLRKKQLGIKGNYINVKGRFINRAKWKTLNGLLKDEMNYSSLPVLLRYEDKNSMRFSIEARTPFADDYLLINYLFSISGAYKIHNGWSKYLLREAMKDIIPHSVKIRVDKVGFTTPEHDWLPKLKPLVFSSNNANLKDYIDIDIFEKNWDYLISCDRKNGITKLWRYINFIIWFNINNI